MHETFQYRLYPTKDQVQILTYCLTACRYLYNEMLADRKNAYLARSIHDASWGMLINFTTCKAEYAGGVVELVNPRNTSKQCSVCGNIQSMPLSQRACRCPDCGAVMGRDHNVAINIENRYAGTDCVELTSVETTGYGVAEAGSPVS